MNSEADNEYSLNWKNHMNHIRKTFDNLLQSNELTDVTLCCEGRNIGAHKVLLSACSTYFRDTFKEIPCQHPVIILYGVEYSILVDILHFIYNGAVSVDTSKFDSFLKIAHMLQISGLTDVPGDTTAVQGQRSKILSTSSKIEETVSEAATSCIVSDEEKRGLKRARTEEVEALEDKIQHQGSETLFVSHIKCEPTELNKFEELLEDPLQSDEQQSTSEFFENVSSQSTDEVDFNNPQDTEEILSEDEDISCNLKDSLLRKKSRELYEGEYNAYREWCLKMNITLTTEDTIVTYYTSNLLGRYKSSTLWSKYSMLRSTINLKENVDISKFPGIISFLKNKAGKCIPKKSSTFTRENVDAFLTTADDEHHLLNKVILIIGIAGACRRQELVSLMASDVKDCQTHFLVRLIDAEIRAERTFVVLPGLFGNVDLLHILRTYIALRSPKTTHDRFFVNYARRKCTTQPVGKNKIASVPSTVAKFLNLENHTLYTGHSFRRTSLILLGQTGLRCNY